MADRHGTTGKEAGTLTGTSGLGGWGVGEDRRKGRLPADEVTEAEVVHPSCKQTFSVSEGQRGQTIHASQTMSFF